MSDHLAHQSCRIDGDPPSENRVVGLDAFTYSCIWSICSETPATHPEIETTDTTTVSGILYWLSRDPIGERGGLNVYGFAGNIPFTKLDFWGLCVVGERRSYTCEITVTHAAGHPQIEARNQELIKAAGTIENLSTLASLAKVYVAAGRGLAEALRIAADELAEPSLSLNARALAEISNEVMTEARGRFHGWHLYTRVKYQECECFLWVFSRWVEQGSEWEQYTVGGVLGDGTYQNKLDLYERAGEACSQHLSRIRAEHRE